MFNPTVQMKKLSLGKVRFLTQHLTARKLNIPALVSQVLKVYTFTPPKSTQLACP